MNIYRIAWVQSDCFGLRAVVIASSEEQALNELDLDTSYNSDIRAQIIGVCIDEAHPAQVVCRESL